MKIASNQKSLLSKLVLLLLLSAIVILGGRAIYDAFKRTKQTTFTIPLQETWHMFVAKDENFKILFPTIVPSKSEYDYPISNTKFQDHTVKYRATDEKENIYYVEYLTRPLAISFATPEKVFQYNIDTNAQNGVLISSISGTFKSYPSADLVFKRNPQTSASEEGGNKEMYEKWKIFIVGNSIYFLVERSTDSTFPNYDKFINSFEFLATVTSTPTVPIVKSSDLGDWGKTVKLDEKTSASRFAADDHMSSVDELNQAMNQYRTSHNLPTLNFHPVLCSIAQNRANELQALGKLDGHAGAEKYMHQQQEFDTIDEVLFGGVQPVAGIHIVEWGWDTSVTGHQEAISDPRWHDGCAGIAGYFAVYEFGAR